MPFAFASFSRRFQTGAGNRIDRGIVGPVSSPFRGRPRPKWMPPSAAMRAAYGLRRTVAERKSTSGISRSEVLDGSLCLRAFLIVFPLVRSGSPRTDDLDRVLVDLCVHGDQDAHLHG